MQTPTSSVRSVVDEQIHTNCRSPVEKRDGMATLWVREHPNPCLDGLLLLSGSITSTKVLIDYPQICFRWLLFTDNKEKDVANQGKIWMNWLHSILGRFRIDFRKLLQSYAWNICCLNSGWGSFSKSKPQSSLDISRPGSSWESWSVGLAPPVCCLAPVGFLNQGWSIFTIAIQTGSP